MHNINNTSISKLTNTEIVLRKKNSVGLAIYNIASGRTSILPEGDIGKDWAKRLIMCHLAYYYLIKHATGFGDADITRDAMATSALS